MDSPFKALGPVWQERLWLAAATRVSSFCKPSLIRSGPALLGTQPGPWSFSWAPNKQQVWLGVQRQVSAFRCSWVPKPLTTASAEMFPVEVSPPQLRTPRPDPYGWGWCGSRGSGSGWAEGAGGGCGLADTAPSRRSWHTTLATCTSGR